MDDQQLREFHAMMQSLSLRVSSIEEALLNLPGFERIDADGSRQGRIVYRQEPTTEGAV